MDLTITPTYYYIAKMNRKGGNKVLQEAGYTYKPQTPEEMAMMLKQYVDEDGDKAKVALASIHPDAFLFQKQLNADAGTQQCFLNCEGCTKCAKSQTLSADASTTITVDPNQAAKVKNYNTLIIAGSVILTTSIIALIFLYRPKSA